MTMNNTNVFLREIWSKEVALSVQDNLVMKDLVRVFPNVVGTKYHLPATGALTANDFAGTVSPQTLNGSEVVIDLNKHKEVSFIVRDLEQAQSDADLRAEFTKEAGATIAEAIDMDLMALYAQLSQSVGDGLADISEETILAAKLKLDKAKAKRTDRNLVITPDQENILLKTDRFTRADAIGNGNAIKEGYIGRIHGFNVYTTNNIPVATSVAHNLAFQKAAFGIAIAQDVRVQAQYKLENLGWLVVADVAYGVKVLKDSFAVDVLSK